MPFIRCAGSRYERRAIVLRFGQVAQLSGSPSGPIASGPPQEPRRQRPLNMTPTAMIIMMMPMPPSVSRKVAMVYSIVALSGASWSNAGVARAVMASPSRVRNNAAQPRSIAKS